MDITAQPRTVLGKKVKALRRQGITPLHVFGPGSPSEAFQAETAALQHLLATTPRTAIIRLTGSNGRPVSYNVMVKDVQRAPTTGNLLHVDLYRVDMAHPVAVDVQVAFIGASPAVINRLGNLVQGPATLKVQGLPGDLPGAIEVDLSILTEPHQAIHARDIKLPEGIALLTDGDVMLVNVVPPRGAEEMAAAAEVEAPASQEAIEEVTGEAPDTTNVEETS